MTSPRDDTPRPATGRRLLRSGLGLAALGVVAYAVQLSAGRLMMPWYMPALALIGVALVAGSAFTRRTTGRLVALAAVALLAGLELAFLIAVRLPRYEGPIAVGRPFPKFATSRADGSRFTQDDLVGDQNHLMVFFRGRW